MVIDLQSISDISDLCGNVVTEITYDPSGVSPVYKASDEKIVVYADS